MLHLGLVDDEAIMLDTAALELAALDHPAVDLEPYVTMLNGAAERLAALGSAARSNTARAKMLSRVLATELGFTGDAESYDDPANTDLIQVLDRRRGLPVSLSILYVALARRVGWSADALNTPGHVLVRIGSDVAPVLIDPFNGGRSVSADQLAALLAQMLGSGATPAAVHVAPMSNREVLTRLLLNQATRAERGDDPARALILYQRMAALAPGNAHALWERARLELIHRDVRAARASLTALLEITREPDMRLRVSATLDSLTGLER